MVLFALIRIATKAGLIGIPAYATYRIGVWGDTIQGQQAGKQIAAATKEFIDGTGPYATGPIAEVRSNLIPKETNINIIEKIPPMPSPGSIRRQATYGWNSFIDSSVYVLRNSPMLVVSSMKTAHEWVRSATVTDNKR